ncbi:MAG: class I SAM-dependent methyltransferase [Armatimonadota bacterium]
MPSSLMSQISLVMSVVDYVRPTRVIDIGVGCGKYGFLCRELIEIWHLGRPTFSPVSTAADSEVSVVIDGIEAFPEYLTELHSKIYDRVLHGDALAVMPDLPDGHYDLALAIDVLEHFSPDDGARFLSQCARIARRTVVVTPKRRYDQGPVHGNVWETHRSVWTPRSLARAGAKCVVDAGEGWLAILGIWDKTDSRNLGRRLRESMPRLFRGGLFRLLWQKASGP